MDILGRVTSIRADRTFVVQTEDTQKYPIRCRYPCPVKKYDVVRGEYQHGENGKMEFTGYPIVELYHKKDHVITSMYGTFGGKRCYKSTINKLYGHFTKTVNNTYACRDPGSDDYAVSINRMNTEVATVENICRYASLFRRYPTQITIELMTVGLDKEQVESCMRWWYENYTIRRLKLLGLPLQEIETCCERGWVGTQDFDNSPNALYYQLIKDPFMVESLPIKRSMGIAESYELDINHDLVSAVGAIQNLDRTMTQRGWICYPLEQMQKEYADLEKLVGTMYKDLKCDIRGRYLYLRHQVLMEDRLAQVLKPRLLSTHQAEYENLSEEQTIAVNTAINNSVSMITGSAGTGKSTTIAALVKRLAQLGMKACVAAFTGKAVARVKEISPKTTSMTLHMILKRGLDKHDVLIIDEISMVPNALMARVVSRVKVGRIVLIGDPNQVQPIQPGDLFNQLLQTDIPTTRLTCDYRRMAKDTPLHHNMSDMTSWRWGRDCIFKTGGIEMVKLLLAAFHKMGVRHQDMVVISPYNEGLAALNQECIDIFLGPGKGNVTDAFGKVWRVGGRVMMTENNYSVGIMNGDEGEILSVEPSKITVMFRDVKVNIPTSAPDRDFRGVLSTRSLEYSWALTVHKSQGSEWKYVVFYIPNRIDSFVNKNLVYTGVSRAREVLCVVGTDMMRFTDILKRSPPIRHDNLASAIKGVE